MQKIALLGFVFLLIGCSVEDLKKPMVSAPDSSVDAPIEQTLSVGNQQFYIEVVQTAADRQQGLMHRESMPSNRGMLFVWKDEAPRNFWMKNTLIPLDMIWINEAKEIVDIQAAKPCTAEPCTVYSGKVPAKYVLELNQGVLRAAVGDIVEF